MLKEPSLNSKCLCDSGRKYKHCCFVNFNISKNISVITEKAIRNINESFVLDEDKGKFIEISTSMNERKNDFKKYLKELLLLKERNPDERRIYNLISVCYNQLGKNKLALEMLKETYTRFPDYLFARTGIMRQAFNENKHQRYNEIFGKKFNLQVLYPERDRFHITEALDFYNVAGIYFTREKKYYLALQCLKILVKLAPNDQLTSMLDRELYKEIKDYL